MKRIALCIAVVGLMASAPVLALGRGNPAAGKKKAATCEGCHGKGGVSTTPQFPVLAGQYYDYLVHALKAYRSGARKNSIMNGMASNLSDQDIKDLAAYFSSQNGPLYTLQR
ncbi:MAG TPA: cytochrome c [Gammaproteobacteria bacterium]|nr:cytochrome c [Gammaproteobacteria bacterium]